MSRSRCTRIDVGVVYLCGDYGFWRRCKYYKDTPHDSICRHYNYGRGSSCLCEEAHAEADRMSVRI